MGRCSSIRGFVFRCFCGGISLWAALGSGACRNSRQEALAPPEMRVIEPPSGFQLATWCFSPAQTHAPGLVLLHAYRGDHTRWTAFAELAQREGYWVATVDLPGHGQSRMRNGIPVDAQALTADDWLAVARDLSIVKQILLTLGADPDNIAIAGEDLGANLALHAIHQDPQFQAAVLLSPGLEYRGVSTEAVASEMRTRPLLILAAENDAYAAASAEALKNAAPGFSEIQVYAGTAHGADLLTAAPASEELMLHWLSKTIGLKPER